MSRRERVALRIGKGQLTPADDLSIERLRQRGYAVGEVVMAELVKCRNPAFNRLSHALGGLIAENIGAFSGMDSHAVLKRLQIEANVGCDEVALNFPGVGPCTYRVPRSLSFGSMGEEQFQATIAGLCAHVAKQYWPTLSAEQIAEMAELWIEGRAA
ncbi:MAG: hypothetical protein L0H73_13255 [Nitrococcus sp.]|nr:hypothetical protein [Nitrococcus sp.]